MNRDTHDRPAAGAPRRLPLVAIIGRPNVGKSTLFNRIVRRRQAIVDDQPGVTRDRQYAPASWEGVPFTLVDTGGFDLYTEENMASKVREQAAAALREADVVLFVFDAMEGLTALDEELARMVLAQGARRILFLANKVDHPGRAGHAFEFYRLGVEKVFPVSAEHAFGLDEVMEELLRILPSPAAGVIPTAEGAVRVALVGRPNVGKSSLVNAILGEERVVVDATPGTTRDAVDSAFQLGEERWVLVDTAGIRRRGRIQGELEKYSVLRSTRAIERADVCVLVLDAKELVTDQDAHIAGAIIEARKACVIVVNKWDLVELGAAAGDEYQRIVRENLKHLEWAPVLFTSAQSGRNAAKILDRARDAYREYSRTIPGAKLLAVFRSAVQEYKPPTYQGRPLSLGFIKQIGAQPPTFAIPVNEPSRVHFTYRRYLENRLRAAFGFAGTTIVLRFRPKDDAIVRAALPVHADSRKAASTRKPASTRRSATAGKTASRRRASTSRKADSSRRTSSSRTSSASGRTNSTRKAPSSGKTLPRKRRGA